MSEVREFEIWVEGYCSTGEHCKAQMLGKSLGVTFDEAVEEFMNENPKYSIEDNNRSLNITNLSRKKSRIRWHIWACGLFDNETDARKSFG